MLGLHCCTGFPRGVVSRGYPPAVELGLLIAVASLAAELGTQGTGASVVGTCGLSSCGFPALGHSLSRRGAQASVLQGM